MELFDQFVQEQRYIKNLSEHTIKASRVAYRAWTRLIGKELPTKPKGLEFIIKLKEGGVQASTINQYIRSLNAYFRWLAENEFIELFQIKEIKQEKKIRGSYSDADLKKIVSFTPRKRSEERLKVLLCVLIDTGCRIEEIRTLKQSGVNLANLIIKVNGKGSKERIIPISIELRKILTKHIRHEHELVFCNRKGGLLTYYNLYRDFKHLCSRLEIPFLGFHALRRTFARNYLKNGGNLIYLQSSLGHARIETTRVYVEVELEDLRATHAKTSILSRLKS